MSVVSSYKRRQLREIFRRAERLAARLMQDSHAKGKAWERRVSRMAKKRGLPVEPGVGRGDPKINGHITQCKHVDALVAPGVVDVSNMRPVKANNGHRGYMVGEYDVLALRHKKGTYFIPASWMDAGNGKLKSRVRLRDIEQFRDNWEVFEGNYKPPATTSQLPLFLQSEATDGQNP